MGAYWENQPEPVRRRQGVNLTQNHPADTNTALVDFLYAPSRDTHVHVLFHCHAAKPSLSVQLFLAWR